MVSYYSPVSMFGHSGSGPYHHGHHQSSAGGNPYFASYGGYPGAHAHHHVRHASGATNAGAVVPGVTSAQFSPKMTTDFNYNHQYSHQFAHMGADPAAIAAATAASPWSHSPAVNNIQFNPCARTYDEWSQRQQHPHNHHASLHPAFYPHQQHSPSSSNPSPNGNLKLFAGGAVQTAEDNATSGSVSTSSYGGFKVEFGQMSGDAVRMSTDTPSSELRQGNSGAETGNPVTTITNPHSPDSGMAISDGVSSSGSPATGMGGGGQHCYGDGGNSMQLASPGTGLGDNLVEGSADAKYDVNQHSVHQQQRPTQARSPFEWMKKPSYSVSSNSSNGKTRTKDKYRVVYTDIQRVELEKEFHYNRYITIRRKAELATHLGLSERQVKIWFQNRRAKQRKVDRKKEEVQNREKMHVSMVHMQNVAGAVGMGHMHGNYSL